MNAEQRAQFAADNATRGGFMQEMLQDEKGKPPQPPRRAVSIIALSSAALAVFMAMALFFWPAQTPGPAHAKKKTHFVFGSVEQAYAPKIQINNLALNRAENFLHQEVTTLTGDLLNAGEQSVAGVELTLEFSDALHQVVLRETRAIVETPAAPLVPGERRPFEISFEHLPSSWNLEQPVVRVSGLQLTASKY